MKNRISLVRLGLSNFKGIRSFVLEANGGSVNVYADNAIGKTTLFDAFTWLLFDKDSQNKKDFQIKTLDSHGNVEHKLNHEVEGTLAMDGRMVTLRKVYAEKWTKKRGSATEEFTGHTTDYYIDGIPFKKNEYEARVAEVVREDIFKLLTSPTFFNEQLDKKQRRDVLLKVCGDISDGDVIASSKELAKLTDILQGRSIEDHRKVISLNRSNLNKDLEKIPVRIDEVQRAMPDISGLDEEFLQDDIVVLQERIKDKEAELSRIQSGGEVAVKEKQLREIEGEIIQIKNRIQSDSLDAVTQQRRRISTITNDIDDLTSQFKRNERQKQTNLQAIQDAEAQANDLRKQWHHVNEETLESSHEENCPACGQALPEEKVSAARDKAIAQFNQRKSERLENIQKRGKAAAAEKQRLEDENKRIESEMNALMDQTIVKQDQLKVENEVLQRLETGIKDYNTDSSFIAKKREMTAVEQDIQQLKGGSLESMAVAKDELGKLRYDLELLEEDKAKFGQAKASMQRIDQLTKQEKELAAEYERIEHELYLTEEFIRAKVTLLESKINGKFKYARFKLFEPQINGGLSEVCETTFDGVPYGSGLNNAARINVGLDIINTLSEHYGITAPIFIDNAEAVTKLIGTDSQVISLIVSEKDKQLRVETSKETVKEAV